MMAKARAMAGSLIQLKVGKTDRGSSKNLAEMRYADCEYVRSHRGWS